MADHPLAECGHYTPLGHLCDGDHPSDDTARPKARGLDLATATPLELAGWLFSLGREHAQAVRDALELVLEPAPASAGAPPVDDDQPVEAPQFGVRRPMVATLGLRTTPSGFTDCLVCRGRGIVGHSSLCLPCEGSGKIKRTVGP